MWDSLLEYLFDEFIDINALLPEARFPQSLCDSVKLIHVDDLRRWDRLKEYKYIDSATFLGKYQEEANRVASLRRELREIVETIERVKAIDRDDLKTYERVELPIPRSVWKKTVALQMPRPKYPDTLITTNAGVIKNGTLHVTSGWRQGHACLSLSCPSRVLYEDEIASKKHWLEQLSTEDKEKLHDVQHSRFTQPILFVSHRWESHDHPDPEGTQLQKLSELRDCFIIYDYCSFPQKPDSKEDKGALQSILHNMGRLLRNVVVLATPSYTERGWCLYEYVVASMNKTLVCDEVRDPRIVTLLNWSSTPVPPTPVESIAKGGDGLVSAMRNVISEGILNAVNDCLPMYRESKFTFEADREIVTRLLIEQLLRLLPPKKEYIPYVGEWKTIPWKEEEISRAFLEGLHWTSEDQMFDITPYHPCVPSNIRAAVERNYEFPKPHKKVALGLVTYRVPPPGNCDNEG